MTRKERLFLRHLVNGCPVLEAAEEAGYTRAYAMRKYGEPGFQKNLEAALQRKTQRQEDGAEGAASQEADPLGQLRRILEDPGSDPGQVIQAAKALMGYQERHSGPPPTTPIIIDDIPRIRIAGDECLTCPVYLAAKEGKVDGGAGADQADPGLSEDQQPGEELRAGCGDPAPEAAG